MNNIAFLGYDLTETRLINELEKRECIVNVHKKKFLSMMLGIVT